MSPAASGTFAFYYWHGILTDVWMRNGFYLLLIFLSACTLPEEKKEALTKGDTISIQSDATHDAREVEAEETTVLIKKQVIKNPSGIYQTTLPFKEKIQHTIAFNGDNTYQLQEKYFTGKKDSVVITKGNWSPSDGYIWIYKNEVVNGRYRWKGETLQYFSPLTKQSFDMQPLTDAIENATWRKKANEGVSILGLGNEPFWSVEVKKQDSISFLLSEWREPMMLKISSAKTTADSIAYVATNDTTQLRVTVLPYFCSDGMSDYVYSNKMVIRFNDQVFEGCGVVYR